MISPDRCNCNSVGNVPSTQLHRIRKILTKIRSEQLLAIDLTIP